MRFSRFVHLHTHSDYSLLRSPMTIDQLLDRVVELRQPAVALTDYGNLFGAIEFYSKAMRRGVKPILGCDCFVVDDLRVHKIEGRRPDYPRIVLLAANNTGWHNLLRIVSTGYLEGFYYKPRIDRRLLADHADGLIALSSGSGEIDRALAEGRRRQAEELAAEYRAIFPDGTFFIELIAAYDAESEALNRSRVALARSVGLPLVATCDCHFVDAADLEAFRAMVAIGANTTMENIREESVGAENRLKSEEEIREIFPDLPEALENTLHIANRCNVELTFGDYQLPDFPLPDPETTPADYLRRQAAEGLEARWPAILRGRPAADRAEYEARLAFELDTIVRMGFSGYFLIVSDFIRWAKQQGIPVGPGRGSGAGSLVAYAMQITDLDPIRYGLLFERFLNPERVSMPDFDIDFCMERRGEVIAYVTRKYGSERVSQIITFGSMKAKAVVRDVGRALGIDLAKVNTIAKLIPDDLKMTLERALIEEPRLERMVEEDRETAELFALAMRLEGRHRNAGTHAAGVVIGRRPLVEMAPLFRLPGEEHQGSQVVQWDMQHAERVGLIKFDFLGLKTLTVIDRACRNVRRHPEHADFDIASIALDDPATFRLLQRGETSAVFQVESDGMRDLLTRLLPDCFEEIIALVALYRPGPLESGMVDDFIERKHGRQETVYPLPQLKPILQETYGVILYQEQVMQIARELAGYTLGQADMLRRAMGKKKPEEMARQREIFLKGAAQKRIPPEKAEQIFDLMENFAGYGFNKSHSAAYALISYQTAWLKAHFPQAFMAATLSCDMGNSDKVALLVQDCRRMGIELLPPHINHSEWEFVPEGDAIRFGLGAIKGVGEAAAKELIRQRERHGPYDGLESIVMRCDERQINKRLLEALIKAGATEGVLPHKRQALAGIETALARLRHKKELHSERQGVLFAEEKGGAVDESLLFGVACPPWGRGESLQQEKEALGFFLSGHPLQEYLAHIHGIGSGTLDGLSALEEKSEVVYAVGVSSVREHRTGKGVMAFVAVEDLHGSAEAVLFARNYAHYRDLLTADRPLLLVGRVDGGGERRSILVESLLPLEEALPRLVAQVRLRTTTMRWDEETIATLRSWAREAPGATRLLLEVALPDGSIARLQSGCTFHWSAQMHRRFVDRFGDGVHCACRPWREG
ncbi:MAG: DNA polymerase III subunit alpha [Zetaproteobacteria bacterium]|nr:MAG: DNA polymerase III subunit alpha [Zetaproteobacteria bacterium]